MQKGFTSIIILIGLLITVVAGVGGYFFYQQQKISSLNSFADCAKQFPVIESNPGQCNTPDGRHFVQQLSTNEQVSPIPQPSFSDEDVPSFIDLSTTKIYSITYPKNWIVQYKGGREESYDPNFLASKPNNGEGTVSYHTKYINISALNSSKTAKEFADESTNGPEYRGVDKQRKTIMFNGFNAEMYVDSGEGSTGGYELVLSNGKWLVIIGIPTKNPTDNPTISNVLSTFKFTDQNADEISGWEMYKDEVLGFSIKYPDNFVFRKIDGYGVAFYKEGEENISDGLYKTGGGKNLSIISLGFGEPAELANQKSRGLLEEVTINDGVGVRRTNMRFEYYLRSKTNKGPTLELFVFAPNGSSKTEAEYYMFENVLKEMLGTIKFLE